MPGLHSHAGVCEFYFLSNGERRYFIQDSVVQVYAKSFADVNVGEPLLYVNSLDCVAVAINQGSFSKAYNIGTGITWRITLRKAPRIIYE